MASVVFAVATLVGVGPISALARPSDPDCPKSDGNPGDGHGKDLVGGLGGLLDCPPVGTTTTIPATSTTTTTTTTTTVPATTTTTPPGGGDTTTTTSGPPTTTTTTLPATTTTTSTTVASTTTPPAGGGSGAGPGAATAVPRGLGSIDRSELPTSLVGALAIVDKVDQAMPATSPQVPETLSVRLDHLLGPAVPPALADAVVSPIVVLQALVAAMTSSSQSLIVPGAVLLLVVGVPGKRRRHFHHALISATTPR
ncbi:MAG: hypothetical protein HZA58_04315 [Acidimicrobiia bacterium]|nr:hypothetical protein [Acidimicrobiia bacterium]